MKWNWTPMVQIKAFIERAVGRGKGTRGWWQWELLLREDKAVVLERLQKQGEKWQRNTLASLSLWSPVGNFHRPVPQEAREQGNAVDAVCWDLLSEMPEGPRRIGNQWRAGRQHNFGKENNQHYSCSIQWGNLGSGVPVLPRSVSESTPDWNWQCLSSFWSFVKFLYFVLRGKELPLNRNF